MSFKVVENHVLSIMIGSENEREYSEFGILTSAIPKKLKPSLSVESISQTADQLTRGSRWMRSSEHHIVKRT